MNRIFGGLPFAAAEIIAGIAVFVVVRRSINAAFERLRHGDYVQLEKVLNKLYEDRALDKITEERYLAMNSQYETEYNVLKAQAQALHERITATETATMNAQIFSDLIEKYADLQELNARILNELIERIVVHEKEIINGEKFQRVDIYYKFVGLI
jgi:hypothetical protein